MEELKVKEKRKFGDQDEILVRWLPWWDYWNIVEDDGSIEK